MFAMFTCMLMDAAAYINVKETTICRYMSQYTLLELSLTS